MGKWDIDLGDAFMWMFLAFLCYLCYTKEKDELDRKHELEKMKIEKQYEKKDS